MVKANVPFEMSSLLCNVFSSGSVTCPRSTWEGEKGNAGCVDWERKGRRKHLNLHWHFLLGWYLVDDLVRPKLRIEVYKGGGVISFSAPFARPSTERNPGGSGFFLHVKSRGLGGTVAA